MSPQSRKGLVVSRFTLRPATPADVPAIRGLITELAEYEKLGHEVVATDAALSRHLFGDRPTAEVVLADVDGTAVGFALFFVSFSTFLARPGLYLEDLYVKPDHRKSGIGKALLKRLAAIAVERDYGRFEWSVLDWNEPSIQFYLAQGAKPMDEWTVYRVTGDALHRLAEGAVIEA